MVRACLLWGREVFGSVLALQLPFHGGYQDLEPRVLGEEVFRGVGQLLELAGHVLQLAGLLLVQGLQLLTVQLEQAVLLLQGLLLLEQPVLVPARAGELRLHLHLRALQGADFCPQLLDLSLQMGDVPLLEDCLTLKTLFGRRVS